LCIGSIGARVRDAEPSLLRRPLAGQRRGGVVPAQHAQLVVAQLQVGHDAVVAQHAVLDRQFVERPPVLAGRHEREADPRLPLQRRHPVHLAGPRIARERQQADDLADAAQLVLGRLVEERRDLGRVARDQEHPLADCARLPISPQSCVVSANT
jgi:hypothetical protein